jgi:UDP-N-acetylglucosamine:LPS N-acetylglucosamine transferase
MMTKSGDKLRICVACSTGGHMVQAKQLAPVYEKYDHFFFTFSGGLANEMKKTDRIRTIPNIVRHNPLSWIIGALSSAYITLVERPNIVITTGAGIVVFLCIFSKLLGAKLIFIESMAKVEKPTLTARILYPFTDLFFVQWPGLLRYFPKAKYAGRLF